MDNEKQYRLETDGEQWIIREKKVTKKTGEARWVAIKWFSGHRLHLAVRRLLILASEGASFEIKDGDLNQFANDMQSALDIAVDRVLHWLTVQGESNE